MQLKSGGFSLVEVLVAAALISFSVIAAVTMTRKSQELILVDHQQRIAKSIIIRNLETVRFQQINFPSLEALQGVNLSETVVMDSSRALSGILETTFGFADSIRGSGGVYVPFIDVVMSLTWKIFPENTDERITITKRVSPL